MNHRISICSLLRIKFRALPILTFALFVLEVNTVFAQSMEGLRQEINQVLMNKKATVGIAIKGPAQGDTLTVNGERSFPMQSVFKFPIALTVLHQIDLGNLSFSQEIRLTKQDLHQDTYSPIREKYPEGVTLKLSALIRYSVSESDNIATDILLELIGGPEVVEKYIKSCGVKKIAVRYNEEQQHENWKNQYENWISPEAANLLLERFYENKDSLLSDSCYRFIWEAMKATTTGQKSIRGEIPLETVVAHKTGHSGTNETGITAAVNDMGLIFLPDGHFFYLSVFVSDSKENDETNQNIIAKVAKKARDYFIDKYN